MFRVLLIGDTGRSEFRRARTLLETLATVTAVDDPPAAVAALTDGRMLAETIVVAQAYPGQFATDAIDRLRQAAPMTPIVALLGSWCEGEMRSGQPWPGVVRVYWHQWEARAAQELGRLAAGRCSAWTLPPTASEEDRLLAAERPAVACGALQLGATAGLSSSADTRAGKNTAGRASSGTQRGLMVIATAEPTMADWLTEACRRRGYATVWLRPPWRSEVRGATAAVFDGDDCHGAEADALQQFCRRLAPAPVIALLTFPRIEDHDRALACGAAAVVSKPLYLDDLFGQLEPPDGF